MTIKLTSEELSTKVKIDLAAVVNEIIDEPEVRSVICVISTAESIYTSSMGSKRSIAESYRLLRGSRLAGWALAFSFGLLVGVML